MLIQNEKSFASLDLEGLAQIFKRTSMLETLLGFTTITVVRPLVLMN